MERRLPNGKIVRVEEYRTDIVPSWSYIAISALALIAAGVAILTSGIIR